MVQILPAPLSDLELTSEALGQEVGPDGLLRILVSEHRRQYVEAVRGRVVGEFVTDDRRECREDIRRVCHLIGHLPLGNPFRPPRDERDTVAPFPAVALDAPPTSRSIVIVVRAHPGRVHRLGSVVRVEEYQRLFVDLELGEEIEDASDEGVELVHEVAPGSPRGCAVELRSREDRSVADLGGKHREEGFLRALLSMLGDELLRLLVEEQVRLDELVVWRHPPLVVVPSPLATGVREIRPLVS